MWKPVIAAVNGVCAGGGLHFVADADIVIASSNATFLDPHVSIGQVTAYEAIALVRKSPMEPIMRMALTGRHERLAGRAGLRARDPQPGRRPARAARGRGAWPSREKIAKNSPAAMRATKKALWGALELGLTDACRAGAHELVAMWGHPDQAEGPLAFVERREAHWLPLDRTTGKADAVKYSSFDCLIVERRGPVGWLINNRPDQLNAMSAQMRDEFAVAWKELDADPEVRVIVHTGEGRAFQTGVDVTEIATDGQGMQRYRDSVANWDLHFTAWHQEVWKPVITAVNGLCAGGAFHWVADADIVIAASDAQFFDPHVSVGQVVAIEAIGLLRKMPVEAVMRMAFVGKYERLSAQRAYELGMISQIVDPPEQLRDEAQALAEKIAKNSPAAMRATKRALWGALDGAPTPSRLARLCDPPV